MEENFKRTKEYYIEIAHIAIPIILQFTINICLNLVDSLMVGRLGVYPLAAVGAGNEVFYILSISVYGLCSGSAIFVAQYWGRRDMEDIKKVFSVNVCCVMIFAFVGTVACFIFSNKLVWLFAREREVIEYGVIYMHIIAPSYLLSSISQVIAINSRAVQRLKITTIVSICAISLNVILNYILIYGKLGFEPMGVKGAAIATLIARIFEFIALITYVYGSKNHPLAIPLKKMLDFTLKDVKKILGMSFPVMLSEGGWSVANALYFIAYGLIGTKALAAAQVVVLAGKICQTFYGGFSNSSGILIGKELGKGNIEQAQEDGKIFIKIVIFMGIFFTGMLYFIAPIIAEWYKLDEITTEMIVSGIRVFALFHILKMIGYVFVCGILRSGGDTKFCMLLDLGTSWLISVPAVFIGIYVFNISFPMAIACTYISEIVKGSMCLHRFFSKKWVKMMIGI